MIEGSPRSLGSLSIGIRAWWSMAQRVIPVEGFDLLKLLIGCVGCLSLTSSDIGCLVEYISALVLPLPKLIFEVGFLKVTWVLSISMRASWSMAQMGLLEGSDWYKVE